MKIMFSAGEASGDLHGANLARSLQELDPQIELLGMGGKEMEAASVDIGTSSSIRCAGKSQTS